jgi:hypothetical protein
MNRAIEREEQERRKQDRFASTLVIAAVRLARDQDISTTSPRLQSVIGESIGLARMIWIGSCDSPPEQ